MHSMHSGVKAALQSQNEFPDEAEFLQTCAFIRLSQSVRASAALLTSNITIARGSSGLAGIRARFWVDVTWVLAIRSFGEFAA